MSTYNIKFTSEQVACVESALEAYIDDMNDYDEITPDIQANIDDASSALQALYDDFTKCTGCHKTISLDSETFYPRDDTRTPEEIERDGDDLGDNDNEPFCSSCSIKAN